MVNFPNLNATASLAAVSCVRCFCRDDLGETLSSLVFAQRAMAVSIKARVNVVPDLDAMCQDLQKELDKKNDELTEVTLKKATADEVRECSQVSRVDT